MPDMATPPPVTLSPENAFAGNFPLLTLHPVADANHRWVALLAHSPHPVAAPELLACLEHWLSVWELRDTLGKLPIVLPELPLEQIAALAEGAALPPNLCAGPTLLCISGTTASAGAAASLNSQLSPYSPGLRLLIEAGEPHATTLRSVQGRHVSWTGSAAPADHGPHLARQVSSMAAFTASHAAGWQWSSGNYGLHPDPAVVTKTGSGRGILLKLLAQITQDADDSAIEKTLKQDSNLSYQLLRLVNSVAFSLRNPINSFSQAIVLLGRRQLQRWLQLLLYAQQGGGNPHPLTPVAAWRAGLMETVAKTLGMKASDQDAAFMIGMFSRLDVLLMQPMADILTPLGLDGEVTEALLSRSGRLGPLLTLVDAAEAQADAAGGQAQTDATARLEAAVAGVGINHSQWAIAQGNSLRWAIQINRDL